MARSKDPDMYPADFKEILLAAYNSKNVINWPMPSKSRAQTMRQQLYAFIRAIKLKEEREYVSPQLQLGRKFSQVNIKVTEYNDLPALELSSKTLAPEMEAIRNIISELDTTDHEAVAFRAEAKRELDQSAAAERKEQPEGNTPSEVDIDKLFSSSTETIGDTQ